MCDLGQITEHSLASTPSSGENESRLTVFLQVWYRDQGPPTQPRRGLICRFLLWNIGSLTPWLIPEENTTEAQKSSHYQGPTAGRVVVWEYVLNKLPTWFKCTLQFDNYSPRGSFWMLLVVMPLNFIMCLKIHHKKHSRGIRRHFLYHASLLLVVEALIPNA